jgi:transcriptional regulator with XRE-family HTH domain
MIELADVEVVETAGDNLLFEPGERSQANALLRRITARRMFEAREISGLRQVDAARALGYANSTQLSLVEQGRRLPPHQILAKASDVYAVSIDYLLGRVDNPERDELSAGRNAALRHAATLIDRHAESVTLLVSRYLTTGAPAALAAGNLLHRIVKAVKAIEGFRQLNHEGFDDLRGGATLVHALSLLKDSADEARKFAIGGEHVTAGSSL